MTRPFLWLTAAATWSVVAVSLAQPAGGIIVGRVLDWTEAVLPGVSVTLLPERGRATHTTTDDTGRYRFDDVPAGAYRVDFSLIGFDIGRVHDVQVQPGATARADGWLRVNLVCDCDRDRPWHGVPVVSLVELPKPPEPLKGQVVDDAGRPLPYATLELVTPEGRQTAKADHEGRFLVRAPAGAWSITALESGFEPVTKDMSGNSSGPLIFKLPNAATQDAANTGRLTRRACYCPGELFVHEQR
jgi:hypothetical protein